MIDGSGLLRQQHPVYRCDLQTAELSTHKLKLPIPAKLRSHQASLIYILLLQWRSQLWSLASNNCALMTKMNPLTVAVCTINQRFVERQLVQMT